MPTEKLLQKLRTQAKELSRALENFTDEHVQPGVDECRQIQQQLLEVQETIAVYKHLKNGKELSPSFGLHARVSEAVPPPKEEPAGEPLERQASSKVPQESLSDQTAESYRDKPTNAGKTRALSVGINDKFRFINELFAQNAAEYNIALEQLNNLSNWADTELYLGSLRSLYGWKENNETVRYLYSLAKKRFS